VLAEVLAAPSPDHQPEQRDEGGPEEKEPAPTTGGGDPPKSDPPKSDAPAG